MSRSDVDLPDGSDDPHQLFLQWLRQAVDGGEPEPHAMTLSTCSADGLPDARVLILKDLDGGGWWFATSGSSPKGLQLAANPSAALTFHWKTLGRQVRVRGRVRRASAEAGAEDFRQRSLTARSIALAAESHAPPTSRAELDAAIDAAGTRLSVDPGLVAHDWALYVLEPEQIEFWQGDPDRRHHRLRYERARGSWTARTLMP